MSVNNNNNSYIGVVKILVLGESGVGKSLFIRKMCEELSRFACDSANINAMCASNNENFLKAKLHRAQKSTTGLTIECVVVINAPRRPISALSSSNQFANNYNNVNNNPLLYSQSERESNSQTTNNANLSQNSVKINANRTNNSEQLRSVLNQAKHINTNTTCSLPEPSLMSSWQQQQQQIQNASMYMIEFHELGGSRSFIPQAELAISLTHYSGVILLYNRHDAQSASGLSEWHDKVKAACRIQSREHSQIISIPRVMLVGVELPQPLLLPSLSLLVGLSTFSTQLVLHTLQKTCPAVWMQLCNKCNTYNKKKWNASDIDDDVDDDINNAKGNLNVVTSHEFHGNSSLITPLGLLHARSNAHINWQHYLHKLYYWVCACRRYISFVAWHMVSFVCNPFHLLSPSYICAAHRQASGLLHRLLLWCAYVLFTIYHLFTWGLACLLFGAAQHKYPRSVPLPQHALKHLRANTECIAEVEQCTLYNKQSVHVCAMEILHFVDALPMSEMT